MSLALFEDAARAHFSNPPTVWQVVPGGVDSGWRVVDNHGAILDCCATKAQAERRRLSGPAAGRWYQRTDWYLGYDPAGRTLTGPERLIIADINEQVLAADNAFRRDANIRLVRFRDQAADDDRIWDAAKLSNGRYQVRGDCFHTYAADELDFLDHHALAATTDLTAFLRDVLEEPAFLPTSCD